MASQLHLPMEKFVVHIQEYGNTSAASVPLALFEAVQSGRIHAGDRLVLAAFGGGFTYAACALVLGREVLHTSLSPLRAGGGAAIISRRGAEPEARGPSAAASPPTLPSARRQ